MIKPLLAGLFGGLFSVCSTRADDLQTIRDLKLENGRILSVKRITRPYHIDKQDRKIGRIPSRIIVKLVLMPAKGSCINVEVWLPERDKWNGRFIGRGNGGAGGHIDPDGFIGSLRMGCASATTDMGTAPAPDIGIGNPEVWKDFGFRSTHLMTVAAKQVITAFYGKPPAYSYFLGHSTGGQQALQEAQRYPEDYDGIGAGVPAHCRTPLHAYFLWNYQLVERCRLTQEQDRNLIAAAVEYFAAREKKPYAGKVISDPRCTMQDIEAVIALARKKDPSLTEQHAEILKKIFDGPKNSKGERIFGGVPLGSSIFPATGNRYLFQWVTEKNVDYNAINFDEDIDAYTRKMGKYLNAEDSDLSRFKARGGKLLMVSGTADSIVPFHATLDYYERCAKRVGSMEQLQEFFRYYLFPGGPHSIGLPGTLEKLIAWREKRIAPEGINIKLKDGTGVTIYPYPTGVKRGGVEPVNPRFSPAAEE